MAQYSMREKVGLALILLAGAVAGKACGQTLEIDTSVVHVWAPFGADSIEHITCVYGIAAPNAIMLVRAVAPPQTPTGTHNVSANSTDCETAIMIWHNHVVPKDSVAESYLYFSPQDEHTFTYTTNAMLGAVGVPHKTCYWTREQILQGWVENRTPLLPVPEQCVTY